MADKLYVISWYADDIADIEYAEDPVKAVRSYYEAQDMYCPPQDPDMRDEFSVSVYEVPSDVAEEVMALFEDMDGDERSIALKDVLARYRGISATQLDVVYTIEGADARIASA